MKTRLIDNFGMKILSVLLALIIWIIILNFYDPVVTSKPFIIPVETFNESAIESLDKVFDILDGEVVTVTAKGHRSKIDTLKATDFKATANLEKLSMTNAVPIYAECLKYPSNEVSVSITGKTDTMLVKLEERVEEQFPVKVKYSGNVAEGYYCDRSQTQIKPSFIKVSGGASVIERIAEVEITISLDGVEEDFIESFDLRAVDINNYPITSQLSFGRSSINTSVVILNTKTIDLVMSITGKPSNDYKLISVDGEPKQILIAGREKDLKNITSIPINIDITGATSNIEEAVNITEYLPDNIKLVDEALTAMILVKIEKLETKEIVIPLDSIEIRNLPVDMEYNLLESNQRLVKIIGLKNVIDKINLNNLKPYIDMTDKLAGVQYVELKFDTEEDIEIAVIPGIYVSLNSIYENSTEELTEPEDLTEPDTDNSLDEGMNTENNDELVISDE